MCVDGDWRSGRPREVWVRQRPQRGLLLVLCICSLLTIPDFWSTATCQESTPTNSSDSEDVFPHRPADRVHRIILNLQSNPHLLPTLDHLDHLHQHLQPIGNINSAHSLLLLPNKLKWCLYLGCKQVIPKDPTTPPVVFHLFPFIGSAVSYGIDPYAFLESCRKKYGNVFTFVLLNKKVTVALGLEGNALILNGKLSQVNAEEAYTALSTCDNNPRIEILTILTACSSLSYTCIRNWCGLWCAKRNLDATKEIHQIWVDDRKLPQIHRINRRWDDKLPWRPCIWE
jgi:hypothetical protein